MLTIEEAETKRQEEIFRKRLAQRVVERESDEDRDMTHISSRSIPVDWFRYAVRINQFERDRCVVHAHGSGLV